MPFSHASCITIYVCLYVSIHYTSIEYLCLSEVVYVCLYVYTHQHVCRRRRAAAWRRPAPRCWGPPPERPGSGPPRAAAALWRRDCGGTASCILLVVKVSGRGGRGRGAGDVTVGYTYCSSSACTQRRASSRACGALCCSAGARRASSARQFTARYAANDVTHVRAVCRTASFVSANLWARNITL